MALGHKGNREDSQGHPDEQGEQAAGDALPTII